MRYDDWFIPFQKTLTDVTANVIQAETTAEPPPYPFITIKQMIPAAPLAPAAITHPTRNERIEQDMQTTLSITIHATSIEEAADLAHQSMMHLQGKGYYELNKEHITIAEVLASTNRDVFLNIEYERRVGFDVRIRYRAVHEYEIDTIESLGGN